MLCPKRGLFTGTEGRGQCPPTPPVPGVGLMSPAWISTKPCTRPAPCAGSGRIPSPSTCKPASSMRPSGPPRGGNQQNWRFLLLDDPAKKAALAPLYQHAMGELWKTVYKSQLDAAHADPDAPESVQMFKVQRSAQWLADHFEDGAAYLFPFSQYDPTGGSIYPGRLERHAGRPGRGRRQLPHRAAAVLPPDRDLRDPRRARGPGLDSVRHGQLRLPDRDLGRGARRPVHEVAYRNTWGDRRRLRGARAPVARADRARHGALRRHRAPCRRGARRPGAAPAPSSSCSSP